MSWVTKVDQFGWDLLHDKKRPGRPSKLTEEQISEIKDAVMRDSNNYGFVVFQDEVHYQVQTSITAKWALRGSEPKVMSKPGKQNVAYSGYL